MSYWDSRGAYERLLRRLEQYHDGRNRFVQKGFPKKQKNQARADWRERKGFARDQAKIQNHRMDGCPPWLKRQCNQEYRAWVRHCIRNGTWEEIHTKTRKDFFDPWLWD